MKKENISMLEASIAQMVLMETEWFKDTADIKIITIENTTDEEVKSKIAHIEYEVMGIFNLKSEEVNLLTKSKEVCEIFKDSLIENFDEKFPKDHKFRRFLIYSKNIKTMIKIDIASITVTLILLGVTFYLSNVTASILITCVMLLQWYAEYKIKQQILNGELE